MKNMMWSMQKLGAKHLRSVVAVAAVSAVLAACSAPTDQSGQPVAPGSSGSQSQFFTTGQGPSSIAAAPQSIAPVPASAISSVDRSGWLSGSSWTSNARSAHKLIQTSWRHGLQPTSYLPANMNSSLGSANPASAEALTAGMIKMISDMAYGRTKPNYSNAAEILRGTLTEADLAAGVERHAPQGRIYQRILKAASAKLPSGAATPNFSALETTMEKIRTRGEPSLGGKNRIVINIAAFDMHAYSNGELDFGSKVIVGKEGRNSPVGRDRILNLKFSPDWNAPASIVRKDLFKNIKANPANFNEFGFQIFLNGRIVDPTTVNWDNYSASNVRVRQKPGEHNVLGGVRFTLANSRAIFLHDTANKGLFGETERAASSGCIRIGKPEKMAHWLLEKDGKNWSMEQVKAAMNLGNTRFVDLGRDVPLNMVYYQAWVTHDGQLRLSRDLYNRNTSLRAALNGGS